MTGVIAVVSAVTLAGLVGAVLLALYVRRGSDRPGRTLALLAALVVVAVGGIFALQYATVYYKIPTTWIAVLAAVGVAAVALFVLTGMSVRWKALRVAAVIGTVMCANIAATAVLIVAGGALFDPPFEARAAQMGEEFGFTTLLPQGYELREDYLPVDKLEGEEGLGMEFVEGFHIQERKAEGPMSLEDLGARFGPGTRALGEGGPPIPEDVKVTDHEVEGSPVIALEYELTAGGEKVTDPAAGDAKVDKHVLLVFEMDGVDVRIASQSGVTESDGEWVPFSNMGVEELLEVAGSLEPVE